MVLSWEKHEYGYTDGQEPKIEVVSNIRKGITVTVVS